MQIDLKLIGLYSFLEECYTTELQWQSQRFSSNGIEGKFSDIEILTCYFFAILEEKKFKVKEIYDYMIKYWHDWFPAIPSYQAFNYRLNRLEDAFPFLLGLLSQALKPCHGFYNQDLLIDSVPIILSKGKRNGKIAPEMAAKTYSASKGMYYYGLKLHWMGMAQAETLPFPIWIELTSAAQHDLPSLKGILGHLKHCRIFGDKAYWSKEVDKQLREQQSQLLTPIKKKKGELEWESQFEHAFRKVYGRAVSSVRQPIEAFFNWIIEKVGIQDGSKVRSTKGLRVHVFGKVAAAMMILLGF